MQKPFLLAALLCSFLSAHAAGSSAPHPIVGLWTWKTPEKACTEIWHYHPNHVHIASSGEEITESHYEIAAKPNLLDFYQLTETVTETNGKRDCAGELHEALKQPATRFIQFNSTKDEFLICKAESLESCFGPFKRVPTPAQ